MHTWLMGTGLAIVLGGCEARPPPTFAGTPFYSSGTGHFTVIGDLQRTLPEERLFCGREDNDVERRKLLPEVARRSPAFVVLLGDLVSWGASSGQWEEFDERSDTLRRMGIPVLAVPGNHDYYGGDRLRQYFARLPHLDGQHWYERRYGPLGLIFIDSNVGPLHQGPWLEQRRWYEAALSRFEANDDVRGVIVFMHHAPFTNSSIVTDDGDVIETFVGSFLQSPKTMAMVTGHAHGYERFDRKGKAFIVTGGGGGPRSPLLMGDARRHNDDKFGGPAIRDFNFVELSVESRQLHIEVVGLSKGQSNFYPMETFNLPWPVTEVAGDRTGDRSGR